jgi:methylornithine synthase
MDTYLDEILEKAHADAASLIDDELAYLLSLVDEDKKEKLFRAARRARESSFGHSIFLYGFVYFSTYCRNSCTFCYYRKGNMASPRYRKTEEEIVQIAEALAASGVHLLDLTMGEDPWYLSNGPEGYARLIALVRQVRRKTGLPIMISPGVVPDLVLSGLKAAGADWYACYQETHTQSLYASLRLKQPYGERWEKKLLAHRLGMHVEEGLLTGIGEEIPDLVHSLRSMQQLGAEQVRTMTFVPQKGTPLGERPAGDDTRELKLIAVMRLLFPDRLIPASLDVEGVRGLQERLRAGANVVTSIIPPTAGLAGVSQATLNIADGCRTVRGVGPVLEACGLQAATAADYRAWLEGNTVREGIA